MTIVPRHLREFQVEILPNARETNVEFPKFLRVSGPRHIDRSPLAPATDLTRLPEEP